MVTPDDVLDFWFGEPARTDDEMLQKMNRWFADGTAMDDAIRARFGSTVERALAGELDGWADTPRGRLALVIVLDQLTRHCFRGSPRAYDADPRAQALSLEALDRDLGADLSPIERVFLTMPLLHSEDLAHQGRSLAHARALAWTAPPLLAEVHVEQALKYNGIIERFGRFPHRNALLGRESTAAELAFLANWPASAPPARIRDYAADHR